MAADDPHFRLRIPAELRDLLRQSAAENHRSINAEILARLAMSFPNPELEATIREHRLRQREEALMFDMKMIMDRLADIQTELATIRAERPEKPAPEKPE